MRGILVFVQKPVVVMDCKAGVHKQYVMSHKRRRRKSSSHRDHSRCSDDDTYRKVVVQNSGSFTIEKAKYSDSHKLAVVLYISLCLLNVLNSCLKSNVEKFTSY